MTLVPGSAYRRTTSFCKGVLEPHAAILRLLVNEKPTHMQKVLEDEMLCGEREVKEHQGTRCVNGEAIFELDLIGPTAQK